MLLIAFQVLIFTVMVDERLGCESAGFFDSVGLNMVDISIGPWLGRRSLAERKVQS